MVITCVCIDHHDTLSHLIRPSLSLGCRDLWRKFVTQTALRGLHWLGFDLSLHTYNHINMDKSTMSTFYEETSIPP